MRHRRGFTLLELVLYIAIVMAVFLSSVRIVWTILETQAKQIRIQEVQDGGAFALEHITEAIQKAVALDASTVFTNPASLVLRNADAQSIIIDTYLRNVPDGSGTTQIRTLRTQRAGADAVDLTSSSVTVNTFALTNKTSGGVITLDTTLTLRSVPPSVNPHYDATASWTTTATARAR